MRVPSGSDEMRFGQVEHQLQLSLQKEAAESRAAASKAEAELRSTQEELALLRASMGPETVLESAPVAESESPPTDSSPQPSVDSLEARLEALLATNNAPVPGLTESDPAPMLQAPDPGPPPAENTRTRGDASRTTSPTAATGVARADSDDLDARLAALLDPGSVPDSQKLATNAQVAPGDLSDGVLFDSNKRSGTNSSSSASLSSAATDRGEDSTAVASRGVLARISEAYDWLASHDMTDGDIRKIEASFAEREVEFDINTLRDVGIDELRQCLRSSTFMPSTGVSADGQSSMRSPALAPTGTLKEGWLWKAGVWNTAWKRRWFVLDGDSYTLRYYGQHPRQHMTLRRTSSTKGSVDLRILTQANLQHVASSPLEIKLTTPVSHKMCYIHYA